MMPLFRQHITLDLSFSREIDLEPANAEDARERHKMERRGVPFFTEHQPPERVKCPVALTVSDRAAGDSVSLRNIPA